MVLFYVHTLTKSRIPFLGIHARRKLQTNGVCEVNI